ncbi:hypothetical protein, partial [Nostoc sp.]
MEADYQYDLAKDKIRFLVLKTIYRDSNGDKDKVSSSHDICEKTGICSEELLQILVYLENEGLIKPM